MLLGVQRSEWAIGEELIGTRTIIAVIPGRGGSKGLPGKNSRMLCGRPVIEWTILSALKSRYIDKIVVSTDSDEIMEIAKRNGLPVPFRRPAEISTDFATSFAVIEHALDFFKVELGQEFDYTILLEPTSPLRNDDDIDAMLEKLDSNREIMDGVISVGRSNEIPSHLKTLKGDFMKVYCAEHKATSRRQDDDPAYFPYGGTYMAKTPVLINNETFYVDRTGWFEIQRYQQYEIDDFFDFLCVERVMEYQMEHKCDS